MPITGATVNLFPQASRGLAAMPQATSTQSDGSFRFESVPSGTYFVVANQSSYADSGPGLRVKVDPGQQVSNIAVQLQPLGTISGRVLDPDGNPVAGANVTMFGTYDWRGQSQLRIMQTTSTGDKGDYLLKKVAPGRYFVAAEPLTQPATNSDKNAVATSEPSPQDAEYELVRTFFPKSLSLDGAASLDISPGQDASDTTIHLQRAATHHVKGRMEAVMTDATQNAIVSLTPRGALPFTGLAKTVKPEKDASFAFDHVTNGSYTLWLVGSSGDRGPERNRGRGRKLLARQEIEVNANDLSGIVLAVLPPITLTGRITLDTGPEQTFASVRVGFVPAGDVTFGTFLTVNANADGSFAVQNLDPGEYRIVVSNVPGGSYVQSVQYNRQDVTTSGLNLSEGGGGEIEVALRMGAAQVDGMVTASNDNPDASGAVVLVPDSVAPDGSGTLMAAVQAGGMFTIRNVAPGHYTAFAIDRWTAVWQNIPFLREIQREGTSLNVDENGHAHIQLQKLPETDVQQTASRLGLNAQ